MSDFQGVNGIAYDFMIGLDWFDLSISSLNLRAATKIFIFISFAVNDFCYFHPLASVVRNIIHSTYELMIVA